MNKIENIHYVVIAYKSKIPVGCGAIREHSNDAVELKRMYVKPENRRSGIASEILKEPENWAVWA
ncbi:MAG: GNAT family N-acetyltransferase [Bacteroidetes bacterium]|nr:GNAT family N-acetyltransferase [Bacteroidota bacterium]